MNFICKVHLAAATIVLQFGFDETSIDGTRTLNQWVLVEMGAGLPKIITIECAGLLIGGTAQEVCDHIKKSWAIGQQAVEILRTELGPDQSDALVPLAEGGVVLHKLQGIMHDTCSTANVTATLMREVRDVSGQLQFGYDNWEVRAAENKPWYDFLCGNHSRNLPVDGRLGILENSS
jgi:hypothetical protein